MTQSASFAHARTLHHCHQKDTTPNRQHHIVQLAFPAVFPHDTTPEVQTSKFGTPASGCLQRAFLKPYLSPPPRSFHHRHVTSQQDLVPSQCHPSDHAVETPDPPKTDRHPEIARSCSLEDTATELNYRWCKAVASQNSCSCAQTRLRMEAGKRLGI